MWGGNLSGITCLNSSGIFSDCFRPRYIHNCSGVRGVVVVVVVFFYASSLLSRLLLIAAVAFVERCMKHIKIK